MATAISKNERPAKGEARSSALERPPIVVIMGHVDHGKTTLLDYIKKTNVAAREAGGITQAVSAYEITHSGKRITFIDTPGHEAFSKMRSRGATIADLAVLVIAAEESLKPQTKEAIHILNEAKTPFVVAINKIDRPEANVEKVKTDLLTAGVLLEGLGGQVSYQPISAKTGKGVDELLDLILLTAEVEALTYDPGAPASGYVLEAKLDRRRGLEAAVIVKNGTLRQGEMIFTETAWGKVKILEDFLGKAAKELTPSAPALILGFETLPIVGEEFSIGEHKESLEKTPRQKTSSANPNDTQEKTLKLIAKAADAGSLEVLSQILGALQGGQPTTILSEGVGDISDGDVKLAVASKALVVGFKVRISSAAKTLADAQGVTIITSEIIYELVKSVEEFAKSPEDGTKLGELEVLKVFNQKKLDKQVVGGKVTAGVARNRALIEIYRGKQLMGQGRVLNLEAQKKETNQVEEGSECGLLVASPTAIQASDRLVFKK